MKIILCVTLALCIVANAQLNPQEQGNMGTLQRYLNLLFSGNVTGATTQMTDDVVFRWNGPKATIPFAGTYNGGSGVVDFFNNAYKYFENFSFSDFTFAAYNNYTIVVTFLETSTSIKTGNTYKLTNVVFYGFTKDSLINLVDIYLDTATVAQTLLCGKGTSLTCG